MPLLLTVFSACQAKVLGKCYHPLGPLNCQSFKASLITQIYVCLLPIRFQQSILPYQSLTIPLWPFQFGQLGCVWVCVCVHLFIFLHSAGCIQHHCSLVLYTWLLLLLFLPPPFLLFLWTSSELVDMTVFLSVPWTSCLLVLWQTYGASMPVVDLPFNNSLESYSRYWEPIIFWPLGTLPCDFLKASSTPNRMSSSNDYSVLWAYVQ